MGGLKDSSIPSQHQEAVRAPVQGLFDLLALLVRIGYEAGLSAVLQELADLHGKCLVPVLVPVGYDNKTLDIHSLLLCPDLLFPRISPDPHATCGRFPGSGPARRQPGSGRCPKCLLRIPPGSVRRRTVPVFADT